MPFSNFATTANACREGPGSSLCIRAEEEELDFPSVQAHKADRWVHEGLHERHGQGKIEGLCGPRYDEKAFVDPYLSCLS